MSTKREKRIFYAFQTTFSLPAPISKCALTIPKSTFEKKPRHAFAQTYSVTKTPIKRGLLTNKEIEQVYNTTDGKQDKIKIEDILKEAAKTDDIASEIDANMILTVREKEILYELLRCSDNKKNKMEFYIKKILKLFDTKYGETTALKNEAA